MSNELVTKIISTRLGVPERLRLLQEESGTKTKDAFYELVDVPKAQWSRYLKGEMPRRLAVFERIAAATGRSTQWILFGSDQEPARLRVVEPPSKPDELRRAIELVRELYRLKTHDPPYRVHDWNVLMALLHAPAARDPERRRSRKQ